MIKKFIIYLISVVTVMFFSVGCNKTPTQKDYNKGSKTVTNSTQISDEKGQSTGEVNPDQKKDNSTPESVIKASNADPKDQDNSSEKSQPKIADSVKGKGKVIVIDPGHGGKVTSEKEPVSPDSSQTKPKNVGGATGISTRKPESVIALSVSVKLKELLENQGYTVIMTRANNNETIGNIARAEVGNKNNADLVIRIHADSSENTSVQGASMLVPGNVGYSKSISGISKQYGQTIFNTLLSQVGMKSRGIVTRTDLTGFNWSKVPVVLIEMGFLSNPSEDKLLASESYQQKIAAGLEKGIEKALAK